MGDEWADRAANKVYSCNNCLNPVAFSKDILSKAFLAKSGRAAMFGRATNVTVGEKVDRKMLTGYYTVSDIYCAECGQLLGWKYFRAHKLNQAHKEGNYVFEFAKLVKGA